MPVAGSAIVSASLIPSLPAANGASISIATFEAGDDVAPYGVIAEATGLSGFDVTPNDGASHDPAFAEIEYVWEVTGVDLGDYPSWNPIPNTFRNRNLQFGPKCAFVFDQPGSYKLTVWAIDRSGNIGTASTSWTIVSGADAYPTTQTGVVSFASNFTGKPQGATEIGSIAELQSFLSGSKTASQRRVLFRKGETFNLSDTIDVSVGLGGNVRIGSSGEFGSGTATLISENGGGAVFGTGNCANYTYHDLELRPNAGGIDPTDGTGKNCFTPISIRMNNSVVPMHVWHNIGMERFASNAYSFTDDAYWLASQWRVQGWGSTTFGEYPLYMYTARQTTRRAFVGCAILQDPDAWGPVGYGPFRDTEGFHLHISGSYFFARGSHQPAIRVNTNQNPGARANFDRCVFEGGGNCFVQNESILASVDCNILCDGCIFIANADTGLVAKIENTGMYFRNCLLYGENGLSLTPFETVERGSTVSGSENSPIEVIACTACFPNSSGWDGTVLGESAGDSENWSNKTAENNIAYGSSGDGLQTDDIDVATHITGLVRQGAISGFRNAAGGAVDGSTQSATLVPTCIPNAASDPLRDAMAYMPYFDRDRNVRGSPADRGAMERV